MNYNDELYDKIIEEYKNMGSVQKVAETLGTSKIKVRRVLITEGMWESKSSRAIRELHEKGLSVSEIAEKLCMSEKNVQSYLPYTRGTYGGEKTDDAKRSGEYRSRMHKAAKTQVSMKNTKEMSELIEEGSETIDIAKVIIRDGSDYMDAESENVIDFATKKDNPWANKENDEQFKPTFPSVLRLRFELVKSGFERENCNVSKLGMNQDEYDEFLKLAKSENGIVREALVHGEMNLHALHYLIQKLFGWQNSHLHRFYLSEKDFDRITDGKKLQEYLELCGCLFKFPIEDLDDCFWDDDYTEGISIKSWLRSKYIYGYRDYAVEDSFIRNQIYASELKAEYKEELLENPEMTITELEKTVIFDDVFNHVLESIPVRNLFKAWDKRMCDMPDAMLRNLFCYTVDGSKDILTTLCEKNPEDVCKILDYMQELVDLRKAYLSVDKAVRYGRAAEVHKFYKMRPEEVIREQKKRIEFLQGILSKTMSESNPTVIPFVDELYYTYDFGDDWTVRITCVDAYKASSNYDQTFLEEYMRDNKTNTPPKRTPINNLYYKDMNGNKAEPELREKLQNAYIRWEPTCVLADGLNVMDDVGGLYGYYDFLKVVGGKNPEEKKNAMEWAKAMGWTGRKKKPENIL